MKFNWYLTICIIVIIFNHSIVFANRVQNVLRDEINRLKNYSQRSVSPCKDMYTYSCGNYATNVRDTYDGYLKSVQDIHKGKFNNQVKHLLTNYNNETNSFERKAILFYKICRENIRDKFKIREQLNNFVKSLSVDGGWPIWPETWNMQNFNWFKVLANMKLYGFAPIIDGRIAPFPYNTSGKNFVISCSPKIGYDHIKNALDSRLYLQKYGEELKMIFLDYGVHYEQANQHAKEVIEFEKGLHNILLRNGAVTSNPNNDISDSFYIDKSNFQEYHYQRFKSEFQGVDWDMYFETVFGFHKLKGTYILTVEGHRYLRSVIEYISQTPITIFASYLLASIAMHMNKYELTSPTNKPNFCVEMTINAMNPVISYMYLHKYFNEQTEIEILDMINRIKMSHLQMWNEWNTDDDTIFDIKKKLDNMRIVFFSDHIDIIERASQTYINLEIDRWNFIKTYFHFIRHNNLLDVPKDYVRYILLRSIQMKEPFYVKEKNALIIPPSVTQLPYYDYLWPKLFKYSKLGFLLSRTIAKAFDRIGRTLDEYGNKHDSWMTRNDVSLQLERNLITTYNQYSYNNTKIDGELTVRQNWADLFGIKGAFKAYNNKLLAKRFHDPIESIPRTGFSANQTFFISYSQIFCEENLQFYEINNSHQVPPKIRVNVPLTLMQEYKLAFSCY